MEDNSVQTSTKKSGFSFRKRRSNSKTRKNDEQKPVDIEKNDEINDAEMAKSGECSAAESGDSPPRKNVDSEAEGGLTANEEEGAGVEDDSSPKGVKSAEESAKEPTKKKTKRRSRGLFRRSSKNKDVGKNAEPCEEEEAKVEREAHEKVEQEASEAKASEVCTKDGNEQVACDESGERSEVGEQSDGEYAGNASGAASECEDDDDGHGKDSVFGNETTEEAAANDKKKGEQKSGTKKKKFFKRGLSLRRSKSKKNQENQEGSEAKEKKNQENQEGSEAKEKKSEQNAPKETNEIGVSTDSRLDLSQFAAQGEDQASSNGEPPVEVIQEENEAKGCEDQSGKEHKEDIENEEDAKKAPAKPVRKVSFADPERATAAEASDDGDSPSEEVTNQEKEDSPQVPPPSAVVETVVETDPIELPPIVASEAEAETEEPEEPKTTDVDEDDELTEVSSVASSLVASSDAHSQADPQESLPCVFEDAEETGSRITLLDSVELGEGSKAAEGDGKEVDKLLGEKQQEKKDGEWIMLDQSCDVTGELQRMRKQTLFSVKRLCCSVM